MEGSKPNPEAPKKPDNILVYKTKCACCGGSVLIIRHHTYSDRFMYKCSKRRKLTALCENKSSYEYNEVMDSVFSVIRQHMKLCIEKTKFVQKMNNRKENILQYDIYTKQIAKLQNDVRRITANKSGLYEDYREQLITAEELCQYQKEYESRVNEIEAQITELLYRRSLYEKDFHIDEGWEETVNKYLSKRKLTRELVEAFVSEIVFTDNNIEVKLLYDDFLKELLEVAEERWAAMDKTVALYMRLSDEDDNLAAHEESNSISHQRKLMLDHIQKLPELKDCNIIEFADDGYSEQTLTDLIL